MSIFAGNRNLLDLASQYIHFMEPDIIGVAFMEMDCKCVKLLGILADGSTVFPLTLVLSKMAISAYHPPRCPICTNDGGLDLRRLNHYGIVWIYQKKRKPGRKIRKTIAHKLFGPGYSAARFSNLNI